MATVIFYEKPGCVNNTKQKALLKAAGHTVEARNLLTEAWTIERLQSFLDQYPVAAWFNRSAPLIKSGAVIPEQLDRPTALQLLIEQPLLIRRPLMQSGDRYTLGFDLHEVDTWLGLTPTSDSPPALYPNLRQQDLQTCPRDSKNAPSPLP